MTRDEICRSIQEISDEMKGPLSNLERALLNGDRKDLRRKLEDIDACIANTPADTCDCDIFDCSHNPPMKFSPTELAAAENKFKIKPGGINAIPVKGRPA